MLMQEKRKTADTPAIKMHDQTPKVARTPPNVKSNNSTNGCVTITPNITKAPTKELELTPGQSKHITTKND